MVDLSKIREEVAGANNIGVTTAKNMIKDEYVRCSIDPVYFIRKYCYIQHPQLGKILFDLYDFQERALYDFKEHEYNIVLKSRQLGISTLCAGIIMWMMIFYDDKNCLIIATKQEVAKNLVTKVRTMYDNLPNWLTKNVSSVEHNKLSLRLSNGSQVKAVSSASDSARSEAVSLLIIDEAAFIDNVEELFGSAQQTIATGGKCIILSTPNGIGNWFHERWVEAESGIDKSGNHSRFNPIKLHWTVHPDRDQKWRDKQTSILGPRLSAQECDTDFISSGNSVIEGHILKQYMDNLIKDPVDRRGQDGNLWVWKYCDFTKQYLVSADVSRGDSSDFSTFHVLDVDTLEQVAEYKGMMQTTDFGNFLVNIATEYNNAILAVDNRNIGWAAIQAIIDRGYPNLFYSSNDLAVVDVHQEMIGGGMNYDKKNLTPGFTTTPRNRPMMITKLTELLYTMPPIISSKRLVMELQVFVWKNGRAEAQTGYNDDLVMAYAIGVWIRDTALRLRQQGLELQRKSLDLMTKSLPVYNQLNNNQNKYWSMKIGNSTEDLTWLIK